MSTNICAQSVRQHIFRPSIFPFGCPSTITYSNPASCIFPLTRDCLTIPCITQRCLGQIRQPCPTAIPSGWAGLALFFCLQAHCGRKGSRRTGHRIPCTTGAEMPGRTDVITRQTKAGRFHLYQKNTERKCYQKKIYHNVLQRQGLERAHRS